MADKREKRLVSEGEPSQKTEKGLEIPIPERGQFFGDLDKAVKKSPGESSRSGRGKR